VIGDAAVRAARAGFYIFPVLPGGKRPAIDRWEQRASADPDHVAEAWRERYPDHNIGIAVGRSNHVVLDLDTHGTLPLGWREPGIADGSDVLAVLADRAGQPWPTTLTVRTPSGGTHLYYRTPAGAEIRNSASKVGPLIDVRGCGGYVVGAGSVTAVGTYEMLSGPDEPIEPVPPWLLLLIFPPPSPAVHREPMHMPSYGQAAPRLIGLVQTVLDAPVGQRNRVLFWSACRAASAITEGVIGRDQAVETLTRAGDRAGLEEREIRESIKSGLRHGGLHEQ
jgi:hypothetical protein